MISGRVLKLLIIGNIAIIILGCLEIAMALSLQMILGSLGFDIGKIELPGILNGWSPDNTTLFILIIAIISGRAVSTFFCNMASSFAYVLIQSRLKLVVFFELLQRDKPVFLPASEINFRNTEVAKNAGVYISSINKLLGALIQTIILLAMMLWISWIMTIASILMFGIIGIIILVINRKINLIARQLPKKSRKIIRGIERIARNWLLVRILRTQDNEYQRQVDTHLSYASLDIRITVLQTINSLLPVSVGSFLVLFIIFLNIYLININAATFISFLYIFIRFQQAISGGSSTLSSIAAHRPYYDIAAQMLGELDKSERSQALKPTSQLGLFGGGKQYVHVPHFNEEFSIPQKLPPRIELNDVSFNYESNLEPVLSNISLVIPIGSQFAIVGPSGSGKSTLLSTILGMLEPTKGHVTIDDLPPDIFFRERNVRLGYVGAESFLIEGSIGENLRYGAPKDIDISDNACLKALQKAHLNDLIDSQPHFLEMQLNENGDGLSAGQKQRLGLARALLGKPQLLILDEVSANLDMDTELQIAKTVSELKGSCTTIIVSHRSGMLSFADSSFVLEIIWNSKRDQGPNNPPNQITTNQSYIPIEEK